MSSRRLNNILAAGSVAALMVTSKGVAKASPVVEAIYEGNVGGTNYVNLVLEDAVNFTGFYGEFTLKPSGVQFYGSTTPIGSLLNGHQLIDNDIGSLTSNPDVIAYGFSTSDPITGTGPIATWKFGPGFTGLDAGTAIRFNPRSGNLDQVGFQIPEPSPAYLVAFGLTAGLGLAAAQRRRGFSPERSTAPLNYGSHIGNNITNRR